MTDTKTAASCHPRRRTALSLDGLCATCACAVRASVRRGQSPAEARAKQLNRVEAERVALAANGAALRALYESGSACQHPGCTESHMLPRGETLRLTPQAVVVAPHVQGGGDDQ